MTSYTSISPRRRHHDPEPWLIDGVTRSANMLPIRWEGFGTSLHDADHGRTEFDPRTEFMDTPTVPTNPILDTMRDNWDDGDPFGSAMSWLGAICDVLEWNGDGDLTRPEWGYRPSAFGADTDSYEYQEIDDIVGNLPRGRDDALPMLDHAGRVLNRIIDMATLAGLDY